MPLCADAHGCMTLHGCRSRSHTTVVIVNNALTTYRFHTVSFHRRPRRVCCACVVCCRMRSILTWPSCVSNDESTWSLPAICHRQWPSSTQRKRQIVYVWWLGSRVVSVLDSGAEGPGFKSQPRRCRVTVLGKLFTPIVPLFTEQQNW